MYGTDLTVDHKMLTVSEADSTFENDDLRGEPPSRPPPNAPFPLDWPKSPELVY